MKIVLMKTREMNGTVCGAFSYIGRFTHNHRHRRG